MRKLIAVGVLVGGLLAGAGSAMAQQGGVGDPLTLAASGVLIPYFTGGAGGTVALIEVASPVGPNPNLHMLFYDVNCARVGDSVGIPETENDIAFQNPTDASSVTGGTVTSGLVAIAGVDASGFILIPLTNPIHSRVYEFTPLDGRSRVFEPITVDTAEFSGGSHTWNPLRTAATFYAPLEAGTVHTELTLICPSTTIQGASGAAFGNSASPFSDTGFPHIDPVFKGSVLADDMRARIYDVNEVLKRDVRFTCTCLTANLKVTDISNFYANAAEAAAGTYTELEVTRAPSSGGTFTGYRAVFSAGSNLNNFWGRLSNGNKFSIQGTLTGAR